MRYKMEAFDDHGDPIDTAFRDNLDDLADFVDEVENDYNNPTFKLYSMGDWIEQPFYYIRPISGRIVIGE